MLYSTPYLKRMEVARAIAHPTDDLVKVSKQVLNMTQRNRWLHPEPHPTDGKGAMIYRPGDCVIAAVVLRLWNAGFSASEVFEAAVDRLGLWRLTDEFPNWKDGDPIPEEAKQAPAAGKPYSPASFILQDFCESGAGWTLRVDHRRHNLTGAFRTVGTLLRDHEGESEAMGNGTPLKSGEVPQSAHVIVLDEILAQVAAATIFKKRAH